MPRFVILRHLLPEGSDRASHWDLMFEQGPTLRTWALESEPAMATESDATELADHRLAYLDYEGPVSGQRGSVSRWDRGEFAAIESAQDRFVAIIHGARIESSVTLRRVAPGGHSWRVSFGAAPSSG